MAPSDDWHPILKGLLDRHKAGDRAATNAIITHCMDRFKQLTRQMLRRYPRVQKWEETSNVFHNVVIRLENALMKLTFDTPEDFLRLATWHMRGELVDLAKKCRPSLGGGGGDSSAPDIFAGLPDGADDPCNLAQWGEFHARVDACPAGVRELFDLIFYQGLSQPEAATILGMPLRTFRRKWVAARQVVMAAAGGELPF